MHAHIEFIFRPRNALHRFLAWLIGAPTCGVIRVGRHKDPFAAASDHYEASAFFVAPDHKTAEIKALASHPTFSMFKATERAGAEKGLKFRWVRRKPWGVVEVDPQK